MSLRRALASVLAVVPGVLVTLPAGAVAPARAADPVPPLQIVDLPAAPQGSWLSDEELDGDRVYAIAHSSSDGSQPGSVVWASADGSGTWTEVTRPDGEALSASALQVSGGTLLAEDDDPAVECYQSWLVTEDAQRRISSCRTSAVLFQGGRAISWKDAQRTHVETVDGVDLPFYRGGPLSVVDGWTEHHLEGDAIVSRDLRTDEVVSRRPVPGACRSGQPDWESLAIAGQLLRLPCGSSVDAVIDLGGTLAPRRFSRLTLGSGFAISLSSGSLMIRDLGAAGRSWSVPAGALRMRDTDRPRLLWLGERGTFSVITVPVSAPATVDADTTPPVAIVTSERLVSRAAGVRGVVLSAGSEDEGSGSSSQLEVQSRIRSAVRTTAWRSAPASFLDHQEVTVRADPRLERQHVCLRARARDWAGNLGPWTEGCTFVDGLGPIAYDVNNRIARAMDDASSRPVRFAYGAVDHDATVRDYDVQRRVAAPRAGWGPWTSPAGWTQRTATSVSADVARGGDLCFRVRARDQFGNVGAWSTPQCGARPLDDRQLAAYGTVHRTRGPGIGGTATELLGNGGLRTYVRGRELRIRFTGGTGGIYPCFRVRIGGREYRRHGCYSENASGRGAFWAVIRFPHTLHGTATVTADPSERFGRIDAVAIIR